MPRPMPAAGTAASAPAAAAVAQDLPRLDEGLARVLDAFHRTELADLGWLFSGSHEQRTERQEAR